MGNKIALFDLDGTMADYNKAIKRDLLKIIGPGEKLPADFHKVDGHWEERIGLIRRQPGWWRNIEAGRWVLAKALDMGFECHVLTKGPYSTTPAWTEKVEWCRAMLPDSVKVTITEDKSIVYGAVLMDDYIPYALAWLENRPRGIVIMPDQPGNQLYQWSPDEPPVPFEHPRVLRFYHQTDKVHNCDEAKHWLRQAFDRPHGKPCPHLYKKGLQIKADGTRCLDERCAYVRECANHVSAGDFRSESGFTPELIIDKGCTYCATKSRRPARDGAVYRNPIPANYKDLGNGCLSIDSDGIYKAYQPLEDD